MLIFLLACAPDIQLTSATNPCDGADLADLPAPELVAEVNGSDATIWLDNYLQPAGLIFKPEFDFDGRVVMVYGNWTGTPGDADFCYQPTVEMTGLKGKLEVRWYEALDDASPYDTINIKGE